jgi:general secretion pathway protein G
MSGRRFRCCRSTRDLPSRGFTLMEVLLVLVILVALGSIAVPLYGNLRRDADIKLAKAQVQLFERAIDAYEISTNRLPAELVDLTRPPADGKLSRSWTGPYMKGDRNLVDPWEDPYEYTAQGVKNQGSYDVWSFGPDRQNSTGDDIGNWE